MHLKFFADSYEYVKKAVIHAIAPGEEWIVHPMLFQVNVVRRPRGEGPRREGPRGGGLDIAEYAAFLKLPEATVLPGNTRMRRDLVGDLGQHCNKHAFLDPDTGIKQEENHGGHIRPDRVQDVARQRPGRITLVFDHSFMDGGCARRKVREKRNLVCRDPASNEGLYGGAVIAKEHRTVCFIWLSTDQGEAAAVADRLRVNLHIPERRIIAPQ